MSIDHYLMANLGHETVIVCPFSHLCSNAGHNPLAASRVNQRSRWGLRVRHPDVKIASSCLLGWRLLGPAKSTSTF